jgi:hypothetical protein
LYVVGEFSSFCLAWATLLLYIYDHEHCIRPKDRAGIAMKGLQVQLGQVALMQFCVVRHWVIHR